MNAFLPSEISRLTYGYLKTHCDQNLAEEFSKSCPSMKECRQMKHKYGRSFHSTVQDLTLETILDQYSSLCSSIFKYFDEDEREHRNVVNLLNIILGKHQPEQSTCKANSRIFQDIQNVTSNRTIPENQITEARGRENQPSVSKGTEMSGDEQTRLSIAENEETTKSYSGVTDSLVIPISSSESTKIVSSNHPVRPSSVQADWKSIFCNSFKIPTPPKSTSQKIPPNETNVSKSAGMSELIKEAVPPQEHIQVFFENLSKGFKYRPHPYLSPAKGLLHQAALSPLSKMYITPTKPNSLNNAASNHTVASNATSTSSICSSQRSIFSPVSVDSPCTKETPAREEPIQNNIEKTTLKRVSSIEETVPAKRKKCCRQKPQLHYNLNDEIVKSVDKILNTKNLHSNTTLDSRLIKNSKKDATGRKNAQQVFVQDPNSAVEKGKTSKNKKDPRLIVSSSGKSIRKSRNEENYCKNEPKVFKEKVLRVFVKDTCEIAELDVSSEFLIYHRDSTYFSVHFAKDNWQ